jgi:hypothetical protein
MKIVQLLDRIEKAREVMDTVRLKKLDTILSQAEKLLMKAAKSSGIRVDDIDEITADVEEEEVDEGEEGEDTEEEAPEGAVQVETPETKKMWEDDEKMGKIKGIYGGLPEEKKTQFKEKMGAKFNMLGL